MIRWLESVAALSFVFICACGGTHGGGSAAGEPGDTDGTGFPGSGATGSGASGSGATGAGTGAGAGTSGSGAGAPSEPADQQLSAQYTLAAGAEEYVCFTYASPEVDSAIVGVFPHADDGVHHIAIFRVTGEEEPLGPFECNTLGKSGWEIVWGVGAGTGGLTTPDGVGLGIPAGSQYLVQLHLLNAGSEALELSAVVDLYYADDPASIVPAGLFVMSDSSLALPPSSTHTESFGCNADRDMNVFAVFPHMHTLGKKLTFESGPDDSSLSTTYAIDPWPFGDQPMEMLDFGISEGDALRLTCTWNNTTSNVVTFGESTFDEMCGFGVFHYPYYGQGGCSD